MLWRTSRTQAVGICVFECERSQTRGFVKSIAMEWRSSRGLKGTVVGPALSLGGRRGWMAGCVFWRGMRIRGWANVQRLVCRERSSHDRRAPFDRCRKVEGGFSEGHKHVTLKSQGLDEIAAACSFFAFAMEAACRLRHVLIHPLHRTPFTGRHYQLRAQ